MQGETTKEEEETWIIVFCLYVITEKSGKKVNKCFQIVFKLSLGFRMKKEVSGQIPKEKMITCRDFKFYKVKLPNDGNFSNFIFFGGKFYVTYVISIIV